MLGLFTVIQDDVFLKGNILPTRFYSTVCRIPSVQGILPAQKRLSGICVTLHLCGGINRAVQSFSLNLGDSAVTDGLWVNQCRGVRVNHQDLH